MFVCVFVLNYFYGVGINYWELIYFDIFDEKVGIMCYYCVFFNVDFFSFIVNDFF